MNTTSPPVPPVPPGSAGGAGVLGVGVDLVDVPSLAGQLDQPGTVFAERAFTARERREARRRAQDKGSREAEHLAARWAAKEAFVKAWSQAVAAGGRAGPPVLAPEELDWQEVELVTDRWGRPSLRLLGGLGQALRASLGPQADTPEHWPVSVSHDGGYAVAIVLCTAPRPTRPTSGRTA
ncbi:MAG: holo-ACP synthase [Actinomyces sp.]|uniref:holo-ACP synthase AcpS n=1 Tax=Actinomyces sp. TaxID=29317 RepID=UPI0026DCA59E|nr:holo-ACP synthase [Actinomyces sp.]MDO4243288.1 holo-ACP synthase [Actinomyces sp.]